MAKRIINIEKKIPNQAEEDAQAMEEIMQAVVTQRQALLAFLDVLGEMQHTGILDALRGILKNRREIGVIGIQQLNQPGAHRMIKNGMAAVQLLTQIDPNHLQTLLNGLSQGVQAAAEREPGRKPGGMWELIRTMRQPEAMSSLAMMTRFLRGMGTGLNANR